MPSSPSDEDLERFTAKLVRGEARWARYVWVRGWFGLVFMAMGLCAFLVAMAFALAAMGWLEVEWLTQWTHGFNALLAVFLPAAFGGFAFERGHRWWSRRLVSDKTCMEAERC